METYWDKTDKQRAELTEEEVVTLLNIELMREGVVQPPPLELKELEKVEIAKTRVFIIEQHHGTRIAFSSLEDANSFLNLKPFTIDRDYDLGNKYEFAMPIEGTVTEKDVYDRQSIVEAQAILKSNDKLDSENSSERERYEEAQEHVEKVTTRIRNDWRDCRDLDTAHRKIVKTLEEYKAMAGDEETAIKFLIEAFSRADVKAAQEWFGLDWLFPGDMAEPAKPKKIQAKA